MDLVEARSRLLVDKLCLDEELIQQPSRFEEVANAHVLAVSRRDRLKEELKLLSATVELRIRKDSTEKLTEAAIKARVESDAEYVSLRDDMLTATKEAAEWDAMREAFLQRSHILGEVARLICSGYLSETSVRGSSSADLQEQANAERRQAIQRHRLTKSAKPV